jgi:hypothetical protein
LEREIVMDAVSGLTASQKVLDAIRSLPGWLLTALLVSAALISLTPLHQDLPEGVVRRLPLATIVLAAAVLCRLSAETLAAIAARRSRRIERDRERLRELYRPLAALFLTRHVTTYTGTAAPYFRQRLANAIEEFGAYRRWRVGMKKAWRALFDRQSSTSAEVEYGGGIPMSQIVKLVHRHAHHADPTLLQLVRLADRSRYEDQRTDLLTDEEYALFEHIHNEHERFSRRVA